MEPQTSTGFSSEEEEAYNRFLELLNIPGVPLDEFDTLPFILDDIVESNLDEDFMPQIHLMFGEISIVRLKEALAINQTIAPVLLRSSRDRCFALKKQLDEFVKSNPKAKIEEDLRQKLLSATTGLLLLSGENHTGWRLRHQVMCQSTNLEELNSDLRFNELVCLQHSKASTAWYYRREQMKILLEEAKSDAEKDEILVCEIDLCKKAAKKKPRHYYAWLHRKFILDIIRDTKRTQFIDKEFGEMRVWCECHLSDFSGYNYLFMIIKSFYEEEGSPFNWHNHIDWILKVVYMFPCFESPYLYTRFLMKLFQEKNPELTEEMIQRFESIRGTFYEQIQSESQENQAKALAYFDKFNEFLQRLR
mmetsp:Transcript_46325/g.53387  ORF Transcript_46325/g.53387 Transcript_46325/m.53387 type:complete len:362 (-) Transcript_46325:896-1981(-)|eukprot:CAMPEP_0115032884 /NCGR_PEP_ID=MMETSP0216-20121206/39462_1 /TAXON_ID=223996 /ORGANISM="Protocruzia adherens, Strain Boccale" /LENGTH=361 /DNA_ID=CAMNT_0002410945 /DNA_START=16 /DNA_END=1101 /DNA_ORIENTATION=-